MLDGLFVTPVVLAIGEALASSDGKVAVIGNAKLARALAANRAVLPVGLSARAAKKTPGAVPDLAAVEPRDLAAVVGVDLADDPHWQAKLAAWTRVVRDGGAIVLVDYGHAEQASRRALCGGLIELEQRHAGRAVITSGLVTHF